MKVLVLLSVLSVVSSTTVLTHHGEDELLPSSALEWKHVEQADFRHTIAVNPLEWGDIEAAGVRQVCRALHLRQWIPGYMEQGRCYVPWRNKEHGKRQYDLLLGIQGAGRTQWSKWNSEENIPELAVFTGNHFITRHWDDILQRYVVGSISMDESKAKAFLRGKLDVTLTSGEILTEIEPIKYELENLEAPKSAWITLETTPLNLANIILENPDPIEQEIFKVVDYRFSESLIMDRLTGMKPGLTTTIRMAECKHCDDDSFSNTHLRELLDEQNFYIGVDLIHDHGEQEVLKAMVAPASTVNVSLSANYKTYLIPYKATVKAFYADGDTMHWKGSGNITFRRIEDLEQITTGFISSAVPVEEGIADADNIQEAMTTSVTVADRIIPYHILEVTEKAESQVTTTSILEEKPEQKMFTEVQEKESASHDIETHTEPLVEEDQRGTTVIAMQESPQDQQKKNGTAVVDVAKESSEENSEEEEAPEVLSIYRQIGIPAPKTPGYKKPRSFLPMISVKDFFGSES